VARSLNLVFDLDGTLIDSAPDIHATANAVFGARGLAAFSFDTVRGFIGNGVPVLVQRLMTHSGVPNVGDLHGTLVAEFVRIYEEACDLTRLYPGVSTAVATLAEAGFPLAICTNKPIGPTRKALQHFDLARHFPVVIGGDSLPHRKPDPAPLFAAIAELAGSATLFVGDSEVDAETARAAQVPFALFAGGYRKAAPEMLGAKLVFDDHAALPRLVAHLKPRL
jgi:phosphoglycolate phosphatase